MRGAALIVVAVAGKGSSILLFSLTSKKVKSLTKEKGKSHFLPTPALHSSQPPIPSSQSHTKPAANIDFISFISCRKTTILEETYVNLLFLFDSLNDTAEAELLKEFITFFNAEFEKRLASDDISSNILNFSPTLHSSASSYSIDTTDGVVINFNNKIVRLKEWSETDILLLLEGVLLKNSKVKSVARTDDGKTIIVHLPGFYEDTMQSSSSSEEESSSSSSRKNSSSKSISSEEEKKIETPTEVVDASEEDKDHLINVDLYDCFIYAEGGDTERKHFNSLIQQLDSEDTNKLKDLLKDLEKGLEMLHIACDTLKHSTDFKSKFFNFILKYKTAVWGSDSRVVTFTAEFSSNLDQDKYLKNWTESDLEKLILRYAGKAFGLTFDILTPHTFTIEFSKKYSNS